MNRPTQGRVSTDALRHNVSLIAERLNSGTRILGVVKADCYGHNASICVPVLREAGVEIFGVATIWEAAELRRLGVDGRIVLLTTPFKSERFSFAELNVEPLISDIDTATWLSQTAEATGMTLRGHVYVDTGMTRNGAAPEDALELTRRIDVLPGLEIQGLASHLATSESPDRSYALQQLGIFDRVYRELTDAGFSFEDVHIANSGGILNFPESHYTLVRPGIALYGYHPRREEQEDSGFEPVMSVVTAVSSLRRVPEGTSVSYGRRYRTERETIIGTLPLGYGDGIPRLLSGKLRILINGREYPVVGTICMDEVMVDLGPATNVSVGDEVTVIGRSGEKRITAWDLAAQIDTIPYEITTLLADRLPRVAVEETAIQNNAQER